MKISIVTATYNSAKTLRDTIESVLAQTYPDIEFIIVDGVSADGTIDIVREYEPRFNGRLKFVSEPDRGLYDAMNKGFALATGDAVGVLNSDDFFTSPTVIATVVETFRKTGVDAVHGDIHYVHTENIGHCVRYYSSANFTKGQMRQGFIPPHPSFYCRTDLYRKYGNFDISYRLAADFELMLRLIFLHHITLRYIPMDFVTMRMGGLTTSGFRSYRDGLLEHHRALRSNKVWTCYPLLLFGLGRKAFGLVKGRLFGWDCHGLD